MKLKCSSIRPKKISRLKLLEYIFFGSFMIGIILANVYGSDKLHKFGLFNNYYLQQMEYTKIQQGELLPYILEIRIPVFVALVLTGMTAIWYPLNLIYVIWCGGTFGFLCVSGIINLGPKAVIMIGTAVFPQYVFYISLYVLMLFAIQSFHNKEEEGNTGTGKKSIRYLIFTGFMVILLFLGILSEAYVNPVLMKSVLHLL